MTFSSITFRVWHFPSMKVTINSTLLYFPCFIRSYAANHWLQKWEHRKRKGGKKRGKALLYSWKKRVPSILLPNALKDVWTSVWDEMHSQPHTFPFLSTAPYGTNRHFWQLSTVGSHLCTAFWEQSTEPAITSATAMAKDSTMLVVLDCSTIRKEQQQTKWELFDFWSTKPCWFRGTSIPYSSYPAKEQAAEVAKDFCC